MSTHADAYPLQWPEHRARISPHRRQRSNFGKFTYFRVAHDLQCEIERLGGRHIVISTNLMLRQDGLPYAKQRKPDDPGAAVYFTFKGKQMCFACDRWDRVEDNLRAVFKTIEALRGIERWGSGDMMNAAFTGFTALEHKPDANEWHVVLGVDPDAPVDQVRKAMQRLRAEHHPDRGGDSRKFQAVIAAWEHYCKHQEV